MRKLTEKFVNWCADKSDAARVQRTIAEAVIIGGTDFIATISGVMPPWASALYTLIGMPVLSVILAEIGKANDRGN